MRRCAKRFKPANGHLQMGFASVQLPISNEAWLFVIRPKRSEVEESAVFLWSHFGWVPHLSQFSPQDPHHLRALLSQKA
jgi:hypothetical protein